MYVSDYILKGVANHVSGASIMKSININFSWFVLRYCSAFSLSLNFGIGFLVGRVFGLVRVFALVVRELRGAFLTCVGSLVGRSLLIRGRKQVCDSGPFRLL